MQVTSPVVLAADAGLLVPVLCTTACADVDGDRARRVTAAAGRDVAAREPPGNYKMPPARLKCPCAAQKACVTLRAL